MADEKNFERKVKRWLDQQGIYPLGTPEDQMKELPIGYYEKRWGGGFSKSGLPDMHISVNGISIEVELKADHGLPSELQLCMIKQINQAGAIAMVLYPAGFTDFKAIINSLMSDKRLIPKLNRLKLHHNSKYCQIKGGDN